LQNQALVQLLIELYHDMVSKLCIQAWSYDVGGLVIPAAMATAITVEIQGEIANDRYCHS
jgi:hypothetical protein